MEKAFKAENKTYTRDEVQALLLKAFDIGYEEYTIEGSYEEAKRVFDEWMKENLK